MQQHWHRPFLRVSFCLLCHFLIVAHGMQFYVKTLADRIIPLKVHSSETVLSVKRMIEAEEGIPTDQQRLLIELEDHRRLADYEIRNGFTLGVVVGRTEMAAESDRIRVNVKTKDNKLITYEMHRSDTVKNIMEKVHEQQGIPIGEQRLFFRGVLLRAEMPIFKYNSRENDFVLFLVPWLSPSRKEYKIKVKNTSGKTIGLKMEASDTVQNVQWIIEAKTGISNRYQRLFYGGQLLDKRKTLSDYGIINIFTNGKKSVSKWRSQKKRVLLEKRLRDDETLAQHQILKGAVVVLLLNQTPITYEIILNLDLDQEEEVTLKLEVHEWHTVSNVIEKIRKSIGGNRSIMLAQKWKSLEEDLTMADYEIGKGSILSVEYGSAKLA
ncbi:hypothetical protein niasHT_000453 [Heterodera trifolii]|uniref:Ubiquitin-like domain-containing protein n=1 Tax=Heterodera trifolii TaxID=157864 RepID=A0ABD2M3J9_9BILA